MRHFFAQALHPYRVCLLALSSLLITCQSQKHAYEQVAPICVLDQPQVDPIDSKLAMNAACLTALSNVVSFDSQFEQIDQTGKQKARVLRALYALLSYPLEWPTSEQTFYGAFPAIDVFPTDLLEIHDSNPELSLNQVLFDYVTDSIHTFRLSTDTSFSLSAAYHADRSLVLKPKETSNPLQDAALFVHEARHSKYGHDVYCPEYYSSEIECDLGTNKAVGYQVAYFWSLLQGNEKSRLNRQEIFILGRSMLYFMQLIRMSSSPWLSLQKEAQQDLLLQDQTEFTDKMISKQRLTVGGIPTPANIP